MRVLLLLLSHWALICKASEFAARAPVCRCVTNTALRSSPATHTGGKTRQQTRRANAARKALRGAGAAESAAARRPEDSRRHTAQLRYAPTQPAAGPEQRPEAPRPRASCPPRERSPDGATMRYGSRARAAQSSGGSARSRRRPGPHSAAAPRAVSTWRSARAPPGQGRAAQPPGGGGQRPAGDILGAALGAAPLRQRQRGAPHGPAAHLPSARRRPGHGADTGGDAITSGPGPPAARPAPGSSEGCGRRGTELEDARGERSFKGHRHERISAFYLRGSWQSSPFCPARTTPRRNCRGPTTSAPRVGGGGEARLQCAGAAAGRAAACRALGPCASAAPAAKSATRSAGRPCRPNSEPRPPFD